MDRRTAAQLERVVDALNAERDSHHERQRHGAVKPRRALDTDRAVQDATNELAACRRRLGLERSPLPVPPPAPSSGRIEAGWVLGIKAAS